MSRTLLTIVLTSFLLPSAFAASDPLIVHDWGTFTSLQDETGRALGGINADVEPLPSFVHDLSKLPNRALAAKGLPAARDPGVTMRLETPVVYFHPTAASPKQVNLSVDFHGGLLTQFYPDAKNSVTGVVPPITPGVTGSLTWNNIKLGTSSGGPKTDSHVWLAPRK